MKSISYHTIQDLLDRSVKHRESGSSKSVWILNLDQIEPNTGRILERVLVDRSELGPSTYYFGADTVLYSKLRPYLNKVAVADQPGFATSELVPLRCDPAKLIPKYLAYYLRSPQFVQFASIVVAGAKMPRMVMGEFWSHKVPLPSIPEQRRIVHILDKAEALRSKRIMALAKLDTLAQSIFLDMFGDPATNPKAWNFIPLGEISSKFSDGPFGSNLKSDHYTSTGVRVIRLQNIGVGEFRNYDSAFISEDHFRLLRKHECLPGDVVVGTLGDPNLRAAIIPKWLPVSINKADCVQIRPNPKVSNAIFISALLNQPATERMAQDLMHGQTRTRISMGQLRAMKVPVPSLPLQQAFAHRIEAIEALKESHRASLTKLDTLFASLQHRAFRG